MYFYDEIRQSDLVQWAIPFDVSGIILGYSNRIVFYKLRHDGYKFETELFLNGKLKDLKITKLPNGKDGILMAFSDAKVSLLEYNQGLHTFTTISIHYYEREEYKRDALIYKHDPKLYVDPQNRVAICRFFNERLAVVPFKNDQDDDQSKQPYQPSYVISFSNIDPSIKNVVDMVFLADYFEPTLAILYEPWPTWAGQLDTVKDSKCLMVVSLSLNTKTYSVLYKVSKLPFNASKLVPVPAPTGGLIICTPNGLIHVDQACTPAAIGVNDYFGLEDFWDDRNLLYKAATDEKRLGMVLDMPEAVFLNPDTLLLIPDTGELLLFDLIGHEDAGRGWKRKRSGVVEFKMSRVGLRAPPPSTLERLGPWKKDGSLFLGSHSGDSLIIKYTESVGSLEAKVDDEIDDLDDEIYGDSNAIQPLILDEKSGFKFQVIDMWPSIIPLQDFAIGEPVDFSDIKTKCDHPVLEIVACAGEGHTGSLGIMSESIRPQIISSFDMDGIIDIWTVKCSSIESDYHSFLIISKENSTLVLQTGQELTQVKNAEFHTEGPTVLADSVLDNSIIVQIEPNRIILLDSDGKRLKEKSIGDDELWIVSASILDPYIQVLTNSGRVHVFQVTDEKEIVDIFEYKVYKLS